MDRRTFLLCGGGMAAAMPVLLVLSSCGDDDGGSTTDAGGSSFQVGSQGAMHTHQITVRCADLSKTSDVTYSSTSADGHIHAVRITAAQLAMILGGQSVTVTTSDGGHNYTWQIARGTKCG